MKNSFKSLLVCFILILAISNTGLAEKKTYTIGVESLNYLPHFGHNQNGYTGFSRELLDMFADSKGIQFKYKKHSIKKLFSNFLNTQSIDFKYPDNSYWQERMKKGKNVIYSYPVAEYIDGVMVRPENLGRGITKFKKLGTVRGFTTWEYIEMLEKREIQLAESNSFTNLIKQTIKGRIDGAYFNVAVANHQLQTVLKKPGALVFDKTLPHTTSHYNLSTIRHPALISQFNDFLVEKKPSIDALKNKYQVHIK